MHKIIFSSLILMTMLVMSSCSKYETKFEGPYSDANNGNTAGKINYEIIYVESGRLNMIDVPLKNVKTFFTLPVGIVSASINDAHTKIAYKTAAGNLTVIDTAGNQIASIANTAAVVFFDWHSNNETLYYVDNLTLKFYGTAISTSITSFSGVFPFGVSSKQFLGASVLSDGAVVYLYEYYSGLNYVRTIVLDNMTTTDFKKNLNNNLSNPVTWFRQAKGSYYFGGTTFNVNVKYTQQVYLSSSSASEYQLGALLIAPSPNGDYNVYVNSNLLGINSNSSSSSAATKSLDGTKITSLDW